MRPMRRKDRELIALQDKLAIIDKCQVCRIAMLDGDQPYIVPLNFGYEMRGEDLVLYFHGALKGHKVEVMQKNPKVGFEMDCEHGLLEAEQAQDYSYTYASIIGFGIVEFLQTHEDKSYGLLKIMEHLTGRTNFELPEKVVKATAVYKITSREFSGKRRPQPAT